jgi:hypothetical protein
MSFASAIYLLSPTGGGIGQLFLNPFCPAPFALLAENTRQRHFFRHVVMVGHRRPQFNPHTLIFDANPRAKRFAIY